MAVDVTRSSRYPHVYLTDSCFPIYIGAHPLVSLRSFFRNFLFSFPQLIPSSTESLSMALLYPNGTPIRPVVGLRYGGIGVPSG